MRLEYCAVIVHFCPGSKSHQLPAAIRIDERHIRTGGSAGAKGYSHGSVAITGARQLIVPRVDAIETVRMPVGTSRDIVLAHGCTDGYRSAAGGHARTGLASHDGVGYTGVECCIGGWCRGVGISITASNLRSSRIGSAHAFLAG